MAAVAESQALDKAQALETRYRGVAPTPPAMRAGFVLPGMLQIIMIVAVVAAVGGVIHSYNEGQKAKEALKQCEATNTTLNGLIAQQNLEVDKLAKASQEALQRSKAASKQAQMKVDASKAEIERLAGLAGTKGTCIDAVQQVRSGLKP